ncbi:uncharacterized protein LOC108668166 [Hyalella azteca]|uniref:Uncharacterized protein LOC108668166 n=1 Tax=Hyalella azteca TaxID=294128 RepID=A0A8B7NB61_HYAAZ|nr:uncharacterized protein LOC108668166 [Hyalella azteca]
MSAEPPNKDIRGMCLSMCPPSEMTFRQREGLAHQMECRPPMPQSRVEQTAAPGRKKESKHCNKNKAVKGDPQYFVKEFARSAAGRDIRAADVRPLPVLTRTLRYLLTQAQARRDVSPDCCHEFVSDRLRAIRQDLAVQALLTSPAAAPLLAAAVRYMLLQFYRMCESRDHVHNAVLEMRQLQETLASVLRIYRDHPVKTPDTPTHFSDSDDEECEYFFELDPVTGRVREKASAEDTNASEGSPGTCDDNTASSGEDISQRLSCMNIVDEGEKTMPVARRPSSSSPENGPESRQNNAASIDLHQQHSKSSSINSYDHGTEYDSNDHNAVVNSEPNKISNNLIQSRTSNEDTNPPVREDEQDCSNCFSSEHEEMECMHLLLNYDATEAIKHSLSLPPSLKNGKTFQRVLTSVLSYHSCGNTAALLRLLQCLPPLLATSLYLNLPKIQRKVIQVLNTSHHNTKIPLLEVSSQLGLFGDTDAARRVCQHYGIDIVDHNTIAFNKKHFNDNAPQLPLERAEWLDKKLAKTTVEQLLLPHPLVIMHSCYVCQV